MATGIVSRAMRLEGAPALAAVLLVIGIAAYVLLAGAYAWRLAAYRKEFLADTRDPRRAFGYFTFAAASGVLAAALALEGYESMAAVLLAAGGTAWLLLSYSLPMLLAGSLSLQPALAGANGNWFLWVVGTQSVAVAAAAFPPPVPAALAALTVCCWAIGVVLYLVIAVLVAVARLQYPVQPAEVTPPYWVYMGATAISVLAGAQILHMPAAPLTAAVRGVVSGLSVTLWAFGTWLVPLLIALGVWRHLVRHVPLAYEPGLWSMVFPLGMYGVASRQLGAVLGVSWLVTLGRYEGWLALAAWAAVAGAMAAAVLRLGRPPPGAQARASRSGSPRPAGEG